VSEIIKFNCDKFSIIEDDPRFITCKFYFGLIGENYNGSVLEEEDYENNKGTIGYTPICGYFKNSDFDEHDPKEYPLGGLLSFADCEYSYETYKDNNYAVAKGIIQKEYLSDEAENILKSGNKKISIEIEVLDKEKLPDGKFRFKEWIYQCITILGDKYHEGMQNAHLEVLNNTREKYASFVSQTIESFSKDKSNEFELTLPPNDIGVTEFSINNDPNEEKKEEENNSMKFNKTEFALLNGMTSNQIEGIFEDQCKSAGLDCWISDWSDKYVFIYDYKMSMHKAIPYTVEDNTFKLDFAGYKMARSTQVWIVDGDEAEMPETDMIQQMVSSVIDKMASEKAKIEEEYALEKSKTEESMACDKAKMEEEFTLKQTELNELTEKMSLKEESILKMGQELDEIKERFTSKETEVETLKSDITKYAKEKKETEAEVILAKYSKKINEDERTELFAKLETFSSVEDFEKEVKAFVCDKYESEVKGKDITTYSRLGLPPATTEEEKTNDEHWVSYIKEYAPQK